MSFDYAVADANFYPFFLRVILKCFFVIMKSCNLPTMFNSEKRRLKQLPWPRLVHVGPVTVIVQSDVDLDSKVFLGQSVAQFFAWTCSALSIMHVSNFKVLAQIL